MAYLDCQVRKETWVPWDLQDLPEAQEAQEHLVLVDLKVNLDSQAETDHLAALVVKEREATLASQDPQGVLHHHRSKREPKEILDYQVLQVFQVRKASLVSLETPACQDQMDALESLDHQVLKEILVSQEAQVVLEHQALRATWEKWDSQDHQGRRVYQVSQVDLDPQEPQGDLVSQDPKVNQALQELDHPDQLESRVNQASQASQEVQD